MALENLEELQAAWDEWMVERNAKGKLTQGAAWRRDNPGEWQKLQDYRNGGSRPTLATRTGRQMVQEVAAWLEAKGTTQPEPEPEPIPTDGNPIGAIRYGGSFPSLPNKNLYHYYIVSLGDAQAASASPGIPLPYVNASGVNNNYWTGVDWPTANTKGWLLKDQSGNYIVNVGWGNTYLPDVGNQAYRDEFVRQVLARPGYDRGCFFDNCVGNLLDLQANIYPPKYPTPAAWYAAQKEFMVDVGGRLRAAGLYVCANALNRVDDTANHVKQWWTDVAPGVDMLCPENFMLAGGAGGTLRWAATNDWRAFWDQHVTLTSHAQSLGKAIGAVIENPTPDTQKMRYIKASLLMEWDGGHGAMFWAHPNFDTDTDPYNPHWTRDMGAPTAARTQVGNGGWKRTYTKGRVLINPTQSNQTLDGVALAATDAYLGP